MFVRRMLCPAADVHQATLAVTYPGYYRVLDRWRDQRRAVKLVVPCCSPYVLSHYSAAATTPIHVDSGQPIRIARITAIELANLTVALTLEVALDDIGLLLLGIFPGRAALAHHPVRQAC